MVNPSLDREALRRSLQATLSDSLADVFAPDNLNANNQNSINIQASSGQGPSPQLGYSLLNRGAGLPSSLLRQRLTLPTVAAAPSQSPSFNHAAGMGLANSHELLLAAARKEQIIIEQARLSLLRNELTQQRQNMIMRESYKGLLASKLGLVGSAPKQILPSTMQHMLAQAQQQRSLQQLAVAPKLPPAQSSATAPSKEATKKALEALGSNLRQATDPYVDVSVVEDPSPEDSTVKRTRGGVTEPFPEKLHRMLKEVEEEGKSDIVSFYSHGRAFAVHDMDRFVNEIMPRFFKQSKWNSFSRQLNLYGFIRITSGPDAGGWYHELFLKGRPNLCFHMRRVGVPQGKDRRKFKTQTRNIEPDFYSMKKVTESHTGM